MASLSFNLWDLLFKEYVEGKSYIAIILVDHQDLERHLDCIGIVTKSDEDND